MFKYRGIIERFRKFLINVKFGWVEIYRLGLLRNWFSLFLGWGLRGIGRKGSGKNRFGLVGRVGILV